MLLQAQLGTLLDQNERVQELVPELGSQLGLGEGAPSKGPELFEKLVQSFLLCSARMGFSLVKEGRQVTWHSIAEKAGLIKQLCITPPFQMSFKRQPRQLSSTLLIWALPW